MIPAGLYLLTSVALSVGVVRLSKNNTLVQDVYCIEMLARVNVLCLDKTGTITNGKMSIIRYEEMSKNHSLPIEDIISSMNAALQETNATAQALVNYFGTKAILKPTEVIPFSSERKYSAVSFGSNDNYIIGAPEFVLRVVLKNTRLSLGITLIRGFELYVLHNLVCLLKMEKFNVYHD